MIVLSVASGVGTCALAWAPLGWTHAAFSEIDPFASAVLAHRWPGIPNLGDFTKITESDVPAIDILVGGTPCQDFSIAGLRAGIHGANGVLALEFLGLVARLRPRWLVWENVRGVLSANGGRAFGAFLGGLAELRYGFAYRVLDAQFAGLAQRRERVFVVGHSGGGWQRPAAVLFERAGLRWDPPPSRAAGAEVTGPLAAGSAGGRGWRVGGDEAASGHIVSHALTKSHDASEGGSGRGLPLVAHALIADTIGQRERGDMADRNLVAYGIRRDAVRDGEAKTPSIDADGVARLRNPGLGITEQLAPTLDTSGAHAVAVVPIQEPSGEKGQNGLGIGAVGDPMFTVTGHRPHGVAVIPFDTTQVTSSENRSRCEPGAPAPAPALSRSGHAPAVAFHQIQDPISSEEAAPSLGRKDTEPGVLVGSVVRRLLPVECERLQGYPDHHTLVPYGGGWRRMGRDTPRSATGSLCPCCGGSGGASPWLTR